MIAGILIVVNIVLAAVNFGLWQHSLSAGVFVGNVLCATLMVIQYLTERR